MAGTEVAELNGATSWWLSRKLSYWFSWKRTSLAILANFEQKILSCLKLTPECRYVAIARGNQRIWTVVLNAHVATPRTTTPLVLLHGMGSGVALWALNLDTFARDRPVYAIDVLGFGRSSRPAFAKNATEVEQQFVNSIEDWREAVGIDKMILLGHSLGGYLAAAYALQHANRVKHLILVDPWGFPELPHDIEQRRSDMPMWLKIVRPIIASFNPFTVLRIAGPWGPSLISRFKDDLVSKYSCLFDDTRVADYLYHCNAQTPSGEIAFKSLSRHYGWATFPMIKRITEIPSSVSMTMIYGSRSWVDFNVGYEVKLLRKNSFVDVQVVRDSGHHVYAEKVELFNSLVCRACELVDDCLPGDTLRPVIVVPQEDSSSSPTDEKHDHPQPLDIAADAEP